MRYFNLGRDPSAWRRWIATNGRRIARLDCDNTFMEAKETRQAGQVSRERYGGQPCGLVGYTPEHFIVRNSWGTTIWGDKSFAYASRPMLKRPLPRPMGWRYERVRDVRTGARRPIKRVR